MLESRLLGEISITSDMQMTPTLMAGSEEELKSLLMKVKEESEKVGLKLNIQKMKIMASSSISSWQRDGETMDTVREFIILGSKITVDGDCSHEIKRNFLPERKATTKLDNVLKSRDITLPKVHMVTTMVFPIGMYRCESWNVKKAERRRTDTSELWCWRRLLRVPWTARRSNQSILKEINPEYSLQGLMLKLQYFGHLMRRADSFEKTLMLGKIEGRRRRGWQRIRWLIASMDMSLSKLWCCSLRGHRESDTTERLNSNQNNASRAASLASSSLLSRDFPTPGSLS